MDATPMRPVWILCDAGPVTPLDTLAGMSNLPVYAPVFAPEPWVLPPHPGTNGHITSWGPNLAGSPPPSGR
jgi:hypothetical protein